MALQVENKPFTAALRALLKILFFEPNSAISTQTIADEVLGGSEEVTLFVQAASKLMKKAAYESWEQPALEAAIKELNITADQQTIFLQLWLSEAEKIHSTISSLSSWNPQLESTSWRVDVRAKSKSSSSASEPSTILELAIRNAGDRQQQQKVGDRQRVLFEMDKETIARMLLEVEAIEASISSRS